MEWRGPIKSISIRLPEDLHLAMKSKAPSTSARNLENAYQEALDAWLYSKSARENPSKGTREYPQYIQESTLDNSGTGGKINPSEKSGWLAILDRILSSGHAVAIEAIIRNLYAFDMLASSETGVKIDDFTVRSPEQIQVDIARVLAQHGRTAKTERRDEREPNSLAG